MAIVLLLYTAFLYIESHLLVVEFSSFLVSRGLSMMLLARDWILNDHAGGWGKSSWDNVLLVASTINQSSMCCCPLLSIIP
jgi:hypothetical protein